MGQLIHVSMLSLSRRVQASGFMLDTGDAGSLEAPILNIDHHLDLAVPLLENSSLAMGIADGTIDSRLDAKFEPACSGKWVHVGHGRCWIIRGSDIEYRPPSGPGRPTS